MPLDQGVECMSLAQCPSEHVLCIERVERVGYGHAREQFYCLRIKEAPQNGFAAESLILEEKVGRKASCVSVGQVQRKSTDLVEPWIMNYVHAIFGR